METNSIVYYLFLGAIALLILTTGGILYLSAIEWRDRRRREREKRGKR